MLTPEKYAEAGTEHAHQTALFMYFARLNAEVKEFPGSFKFRDVNSELLWTVQSINVCKLMFAIPNGGKRGEDKLTRAIRGGRMKAEGVKSGIPDIMLPVCKLAGWNNVHGLFIELKRPRSVGKTKGVVADKQSDYALALIEQGYAVETCYGWIEARQAIWNYLH